MVHMSYHPSYKDREYFLMLQMGRLRAREVNGLLQQAPALLIHSPAFCQYGSPLHRRLNTLSG